MRICVPALRNNDEVKKESPRLARASENQIRLCAATSGWTLMSEGASRVEVWALE
jgi:hypothetical protein